jgi:hypothetical protein
MIGFRISILPNTMDNGVTSGYHLNPAPDEGLR